MFHPALSRFADVSAGVPHRYSLGYMKSVDNSRLPLGMHRSTIMAEESFGQSGMGGSLGLADPKDRMSLGYVMNRMASLKSPSASRLQALVGPSVSRWAVALELRAVGFDSSPTHHITSQQRISEQGLNPSRTLGRRAGRARKQLNLLPGKQSKPQRLKIVYDRLRNLDDASSSRLSAIQRTRSR